MHYRKVKTLLEFGLGLVGYPNLRVVTLIEWAVKGKICSIDKHILDQGAICVPCKMIHFRPKEIEEFDIVKLQRMAITIQSLMAGHKIPQTPISEADSTNEKEARA